MFENYCKAAVVISIRNEEEDKKAREKLGIFLDHIQDLSKKIEFNTLKDHVDKVISTLSPREARVLKFRLGLEDGRRRTMDEAAREFMVTRERIRQIEAKAFRKLRHRNKELREFMSIFNTES